MADLAADPAWADDPYVQAARPRAALCLPIGGGLGGLLYLENDLTPGAFTPSHLTVLEALIQSEKLAAMGQLVAGVAHELNTPLGAIAASIGNLDAAMDQALDGLPRALSEATPDEVERLRALVAASLAAPALTSREERRQRRALTAQLEALEIPDARRVARLLVQVGAADQLDAYLPLARSPRAEPLLKGASNLAGLRRNADTIRTAVERANKIVFALKSYAHPGSAKGERREASVAENVETVLTLYHNQIKRGRLEVSVRRDGDSVVVEVIDSGPGVPPEVQARLFEPFYTTKAPGEGSGLGLSISRDIVTKHSGAIELDTEPGRTCFRVVLPLTPGAEA